MSMGVLGIRRSLFAIRKIRSAIWGYCLSAVKLALWGDFEESGRGNGKAPRREDRLFVYSFPPLRTGMGLFI